MNERLVFFGAIAGILGLFVAILALLRDVFDFQLEWADSRNLLKRLAANRLVQIIVVVALFGFAFWSLYSRMQGLESIVARQDAEITSAYVTQTAQAASLLALEGTRVAQDAELSSAQATLSSQPLSQSEICDQVSILAIPDQVTLNDSGDASVQTDVDYELLAPPLTGVTVMLHAADVFVQNGSDLVHVASGVHTGHFGEHVAAGESIRLDDLVWLGRDELDKAKELNSALLLERKTFYLTSDQGFYCKKPVDVPIKLIGPQ
jgi:hypothetical protein